MMNRKTLSAAVAAACLGMSGAASALTFVNPVPADTLVIRYSGASAQDLALEKVLASVCVANSLNAAQQLNNSVYYCTIAPNTAPNPGVSTTATFTGVPAATYTKLLVFKSSIGGSGNGTTPVANNAATPGFLQLANVAAPGCLGAAVNITSSVLPTYTSQPVVQVATCNATAGAIPDVGLSDVEPSLLGLSSALNTRLERFEGAHLVFGIAVTKLMRDQLQTAQGLTPNSELPAQQPRLEGPQLTAMMNGSITDFAQIGKTTGSQLVHMALRSATSGTTRVNNAYFGTDTGQCILNAPQRKGSTTTSTASTVCSTLTAGGAAGGEVLYGSGSDNVLTCLANHNAANRWAFGILSMETSTTTAGGTTTIPSSSDAIRFIKVDSDLPTLVNVANGLYGLWASVSYQYRNGTGGVPAILPERLEAAETIRAYLANKNVLQDVNSTITQTWANGGLGGAGETGYLAAPSLTNPAPVQPVTLAALAANPTNPYTKVAASGQNNCIRGLKF